MERRRAASCEATDDAWQGEDGVREEQGRAKEARGLGGGGEEGREKGDEGGYMRIFSVEYGRLGMWANESCRQGGVVGCDRLDCGWHGHGVNLAQC